MAWILPTPSMDGPNEDIEQRPGPICPSYRPALVDSPCISDFSSH